MLLLHFWEHQVEHSSPCAAAWAGGVIHEPKRFCTRSSYQALVTGCICTWYGNSQVLDLIALHSSTKHVIGSH
ncbi:hypothetical protein UPYG_G00351340 [Umbra pygmaea]|uniref:Uncharacterized protein n=1 Tax=Umbra pygmaea TaxID=75934 RepID=A0ABD0WG57_UMBPY